MAAETMDRWSFFWRLSRSLVAGPSFFMNFGIANVGLIFLSVLAFACFVVIASAHIGSLQGPAQALVDRLWVNFVTEWDRTSFSRTAPLRLTKSFPFFFADWHRSESASFERRGWGQSRSPSHVSPGKELVLFHRILSDQDSPSSHIHCIGVATSRWGREVL
jgi:hypothetical protein